MSSSAFDDKNKQPDEHSVAEVLGESAQFWQRIREQIRETHGECVEEWKFYNQTSGWIMKLLRKKRNLFFLVPLHGLFRISFTLGDKAVAAVEKSELPESIISALRDARKYVEGRGIQIEVKSAEDAENVLRLVDIKINN